MSTRLQTALGLALCLSTGWVHADEPATAAVTEAAEIQLKNGESKRGTIVAVEPGQRVIVIVAGEQSVIPWDEVARIVGGPKESTPTTTTVTSPPIAPAPIAPVPIAPPPVPTLAPMKGVPTIHIESDWPDAELSRIDGQIGPIASNAYGHLNGTALSKYVCRAPCNKLVDGREGHSYFISAPGMYPSPSFRLEDYNGHVTARVHGTSYSRLIAGIALVGGGGVLTLGGGMFFGMSYLTAGETPSADNPDPERTAGEVRSIGLGIGAVGLMGVVSGILLLSGGTTRVEIIESKRGHSGLVLDGGVLRF